MAPANFTSMDLPRGTKMQLHLVIKRTTEFVSVASVREETLVVPRLKVSEGKSQRYGEKCAGHTGGGGRLASAEQRVPRQRDVKFVDGTHFCQGVHELAAAFAMESLDVIIAGQLR